MPCLVTAITFFVSLASGAYLHPYSMKSLNSKSKTELQDMIDRVSKVSKASSKGQTISVPSRDPENKTVMIQATQSFQPARKEDFEEVERKNVNVTKYRKLVGRLRDSASGTGHSDEKMGQEQLTNAKVIFKSKDKEISKIRQGSKEPRKGNENRANETPAGVESEDIKFADFIVGSSSGYPELNEIRLQVWILRSFRGRLHGTTLMKLALVIGMGLNGMFATVLAACLAPQMHETVDIEPDFSWWASEEDCYTPEQREQIYAPLNVSGDYI